jgi:hypothetical protein
MQGLKMQPRPKQLPLYWEERLRLLLQLLVHHALQWRWQQAVQQPTLSLH